MLNEIKRILELLSQTRPGTEEYDRLLHNLSSALYIHDEVEEVLSTGRTEHEPSAVKEEKVVPVKEPEKPKKKAKEVTVVEPSAQPELSNNPSEITRESVRSLLTTAADKGILIKPFIQKYVPEGKSVCFSSIPSSSYADLSKDLEEGINNAR